MSASAIWTVHCDRCCRWDTEWETKAEAHKDARRHGWLVTTTTNLCPNCRPKGE